MNVFEKASSFFQGRHTMFVLACMAIGVSLSWFKRLDANLVTLLLGLQGMILVHSAKDDYFKNKPEDIKTDLK